MVQWTLIVSTMLFSMGIGSRISRYIRTNLIENFILIEFVLSILASYASLATYSVAAFSPYTGTLIYGMSIAIGILIGMEIPLAMRLNSEFEALNINISSILENDYYGSLLGGLFFAFVALPYVGLTYTPFILGGINFSVALLLWLYLRDHIERKRSTKLVLMGVFTTGLLVSGLVFAEPIVLFGEQKKYADKVIYSEQSKYQKIVITQWKDDYWLFINGNQQLSTLDEPLYHEPLVHPAMHMAPQKGHILVLGGGDGAAVRELLKYPEIVSIMVVDLDPAMTDLGKTHPVLLEMNQGSLLNQKVTIINKDAFQFVQDTEEFFDVIICDFPDPKTVELGRLYSKEFYGLCHKILRPHGFLVTQAGSPYYAPKAFRCIEKTVKSSGFSVLSMHNQILTLGEWGWVLGTKAFPENSLDSVLYKQDFSKIETSWLSNESALGMTLFGKDFYAGKDTTIEVNTVRNPVLYRYYRQGVWDLY